jgi:hypothetical protein
MIHLTRINHKKLDRDFLVANMLCSIQSAREYQFGHNEIHVKPLGPEPEALCFVRHPPAAAARPKRSFSECVT